MNTKDSQPRYPVGIQTFSKLIEGGYVYIDKTGYINELINGGKYYFLSRPRRFGKSLLLSTIEAYYKGRRDLFSGLALDSLTDEWDEHPVIHLDLNVDEYNMESSLNTLLDLKLKEWEREYGVEHVEGPLSYRFGRVIQGASMMSGKKVVVLIDEYDKPMLNAIHNESLADKYRSTLKAFYSNLKSMDRYIEFAMLTGVARFSKVSIFSDLNNLRDISFEKRFAGICGVSESEIDVYFKEGIQSLAGDMHRSVETIREELRMNYDGYHFAENSEGVYNPFSLMNVFSFNSLDNYWFDSGTPTYLVKLLEKKSMELRDISGYKMGRSALKSAGILSTNPVPALYQAGYITISGYDAVYNSYILDYPNREVKESFLNFLVPYYTEVNEGDTEFVISEFTEDVRHGRVEVFMQRLSGLVARVPYGGKGSAPEDHFQNVIYLIFTLMGFMARVEDRTSGGRIDLTVETEKNVYIFEFKIDRTAAAAMEQIMEKRYWEPFISSGKTIYLVGANFSTATRTLSEYIIDKVSI